MNFDARQYIVKFYCRSDVVDGIAFFSFFTSKVDIDRSLHDNTFIRLHDYFNLVTSLAVISKTCEQSKREAYIVLTRNG